MDTREEIIYKKLKGELPLGRSGHGSADAAPAGALPDAETAASPVFTDEHRGGIRRKLNERMLAMDATRVNLACRELHSARRVIGRTIVFCKRVIRKLLKWYVEPIALQQTDFNNAVLPSFGLMIELEDLHFGRLGEAERRLAAMEEETAVREARLLSWREQDRLTLEQLEARTENAGLTLSQAQARIDALLARLDGYEKRLIAMEEDKQTLETELAAAKFSSQLTAELAEQMDLLRAQGAFLAREQEQPITRFSTSQSGEDCILAYVLRALGKREEECSYLDLGANHARELSNTYFFYRKGARGVLVEANPALIGELALYRSGDVILNRCIARTSGELVPFYIFNGDGLSTPDRETAEETLRIGRDLCITDTVEVFTISVNELMETYFSTTGAPVLLNIDIEGNELDILRSIDLEAHRPLLICIEVIPYRPHLVIDEKREEALAFLKEKDYVEYAFTGINSILLDRRRIGGWET